MLESTFDTITAHFPDFERSPFVQEKFYEDWSHDTTHMWQQNRGVIGHKLEDCPGISMRMYGFETERQPAAAYARKIAQTMPFRGG